MGLFGTAKPVLAVDFDAILQTKGVRGRAAPRQQLQILRSLSRFVQREKIKVIAVMTGQPLDKAPHNKVFEGMRVRYAQSAEMMAGELLKALKQAGSSGILVTDNIELEKKVRQGGGATLRISTFRKLLDDSNESLSGNNNGGNGGGRSNGRRPRRRKPAAKTQNSSVPAENARNENSNADTISQMIDLVD